MVRVRVRARVRFRVRVTGVFARAVLCDAGGVAPVVYARARRARSEQPARKAAALAPAVVLHAGPQLFLQERHFLRVDPQPVADAT